LLYNSFTFLSLFVEERLQAALPSARKRMMLRSSIISMKMINERIQTMLEQDTESVLLSMCLMLFHGDSQSGDLARSIEQSLFSPHMLFGEAMGSAKVSPIKGHILAVQAIINRIGGLGRLNDRCLAYMIGLWVLLLVEGLQLLTTCM
jgi:hypothetical protein